MTQEHIHIARSVREQVHREEAACRLCDGQVVGQFVRATCILWIDAENPQAAERIYQIKGAKRTGRPFSIMLETNSFIAILDEEAIYPALHRFFLDPDELEDRLGALCMVRAPILKQIAKRLPEYAYSVSADGTCWLQSWVPCGYIPGRQVLEEMWSIGMRLPAVTSMNVSGQPEIVEQDEAVAFCERYSIPAFLRDPLDTGAVRGSFPIISIDRQGAHVVRAGHFQPSLFKYLLDGTEVDLSGMSPSKFPLLKTHTEAEARETPAPQLRKELLRIMDGIG